MSSLSRLAILAFTTASIVGCSVNPLVQWKPANDPPTSADAALGDAQALRLQYEARSEQHLGRKLVTNDLLFGLGVATFAAVAGKAHRDVPAVLAGLGASTYLYSTTGIQQSNLDAYQVGIGRVNCAAKIGRALRVDPAVARQQFNDATSLRTELPRLAGFIAEAETLVLSATDLDEVFKTAATQRITEAKAVLARANDISKDAEALLERDPVIASKLIDTLNAIHQAVNEMASKGVAEPKAVLDSLNGLLGVSSGIIKSVTPPAAPAAPASAAYSAGAANESDSGGAAPTAAEKARAAAMRRFAPDIRAALIKMAQQQSTVSVLAESIAQRSTRQIATVDANDFDKCVPDATKFNAFKVSTASLTFTASKDDDQSQSFTVSGGTTNYTARFTSQPTFGLSIEAPLAGGATFVVKVPKSTKGPHDLTLVVEDSSAARNTASVAVKVNAAPAAAADKPSNESDSGRAVGLSAALSAARKAGASISIGSGSAKAKLTIRTWTSDSAGSRVVMSCQLGDRAARLAAADARKKLLALLIDGFSLSSDVADSLRSSPQRLSIVSDNGCVQ
jgi:hypothetical protein